MLDSALALELKDLGSQPLFDADPEVPAPMRSASVQMVGGY